jgi:integrase
VQRKVFDGDAGRADRTLAGCLDLWLADVKASVAPATYRRYEFTVAQHIRPYLGAARLADLAAFDVARWYKKLEDDGVSADARHKAGAKLRQCLGYAVRLGMVLSSVAHSRRLPRVERKRIDPLREEEVGPFLASARPKRLFALYLTALDSGARQGELLALEWPDVDWALGEININKSLDQNADEDHVKEPKTAAGRRRVMLTPETIAVLRQHCAAMEKEGHGSKLVFPTQLGAFVSKRDLSDAMETICRQARVGRRRFHDLRHTCATLLLLRGENVMVVSERLGHSSVEITLKTYTHVLPTMQQGAVARLSGLLGPALAHAEVLAANGYKLATETAAAAVKGNGDAAAAG